MNKQEHIKHHKLLHAYLDELLADWIGETEGLPSKCTLVEFTKWSHQQTIAPSDRHERYPDVANAERIHGGAGDGKPRDASTPLDDASC